MITAYWEYFIQQVNSIEVNTVSSIFKLSLSLLLGCLVGFERKRKGQIAGVRTFALISMGATLAMILSIYVPQEYLGLKNGDPGRIAAQVVTGIGFLGAGAIIQMKGSVRGLTTAAGIWIIAAIGMAVGVGLYSLSLAATALVLVVLLFVERLEHHINAGAESRIIRIRLSVIAGISRSRPEERFSFRAFPRERSGAETRGNSTGWCRWYFRIRLTRFCRPRRSSG